MGAGQIGVVMLIGLAAGFLGGLAGIGGSLIMIPGLAFLLGYHDLARSDHHVYMAAAMTVNVLVAIPAAVQHRRAGSVRAELARWILPAMTVAVVAGVLLSNRLGGALLKDMLAVFIAAYCALNIKRIVRPIVESERKPERTGRGLIVGIGGAAGFIGGLLGLGGGVVLVPALQVLARVRLRQAIGTSAAVMWVSAAIGAAFKLATLPGRGHSPWEALILAAFMGPGAVLGAMLGARATHTLPVRAVRAVVTVMLLGAAAKLAGLF